ncbi:subtilase-type protease inhibitor [Streptomyces sp. NPDC005963]|uniref:subtilase-type protease inhibitor n=1 Tax=Streptomyces sp. NPDC005963 TaxID=3156721 RepID=UPI0033DA1CC0
MRRTHSVLAVATALVLGGTAVAAAEAAQPARAGTLYAPSALVLTIGKGAANGVTSTVERAVTLDCGPSAGGSHPASTAACGELERVDGEFTALPSALPYTTCTRQFEPVTVTADGVWRGRHLTWSGTFNNGCEMVASLGGGAIFAF